MQSFIGQLGVFMICAQAIVYFRPKAVYEKYLRLLLGIMILIQIFQPFASLFWGGNKLVFEKKLEQFRQELESSMAEAAKSVSLSEEQMHRMTMEEVQERLAEEERENSSKTEIEQTETTDLGIEVKIDRITISKTTD